MRDALWGDRKATERLAIGGFVLAAVAAAVLLLWEVRGTTITVDEWSWGFASRTNFDLDAFVDPHNGHFQAVMVLITKAALQVFGADAALPLRLLAVAMHLATAGCVFLLMRQAIGARGALVPSVLVLFLGAANDGIIGSHGMSVTITVLVGLGAWLALGRRTTAWDAVAAALLTVGAATETTVMPFVLGAGAMIWLDGESRRSRYWVVALPLIVYALWWLAWGHTENSDAAIANFAALPSFAFDSLAATVASITGVFTVPGTRDASFDLSAGQGLAGGLLAVTLALVLTRRHRLGVASLVPLVALLSFWVFTSGVADPARQPYSSRFLYIDVILLLLVLVQEAAASPVRSRATLVLSGVCALALLPNIRELTYAGDGARLQAEVNRAVMGAADLVADEAPAATLLEDPNDIVGGQVADLALPIEQYAASAARFGVPSYSEREIEAAAPMAREATDRFLARALGIGVVPATRRHTSLPPGIDVSQVGGALKRAAGCLRFVPSMVGARVVLDLPPGGLWVEPSAGPPVRADVRRFADRFDVEAGEVLAGRPSLVKLPDSAAADGWQARLRAGQPLLVCAA